MISNQDKTVTEVKTPKIAAPLVSRKRHPLLTALIWFMHRANIARLLNGTEGKIGR